jgi:putative hydrolase of the HAD superfamily
MKKRKLISFDLDSTLVDPAYTTHVWEIGIPRLYAKKHDLPLSEATATVMEAYERIGDARLEWYDIRYWFDFFELPARWQDLIAAHRDKIRAFPEVNEVLQRLVTHYDLIVLSNAAREFVEVEIEEAQLGSYFTRTFSVTSDFGQLKKVPHCYEQVLEIMGAEPSQVVHVGDHYEFDYVVPKSMGIEAYHLDRDGKRPKDEFRVRDLRDFAALKLR